MRRTVCTLAVALGVACAGKFDPSQYPTPDALYDASVALYREGKCTQAIEGFRRLTFELNSFDPRLVEARFYQADCTLDGGERLEAARLFRRVADEYPRHPLAPAALLRAGDAFALLWKKPTLDPTYGETALATYRELLARFPAADAADSAQGRIARLNEWFAEKEYKSGEFYFRLRAYDSAIIYYKDVVANYGQTTFAAKAVVRLIEAYERIGYADEKAEMCRYLRQFYPDAERAESVCPETFAAQ
jgi:outer membrane protein assembly factor BamD